MDGVGRAAGWREGVACSGDECALAGRNGEDGDDAAASGGSGSAAGVF